jgi:membrane associated rhomboid family serine protease
MSTSLRWVLMPEASIAAWYIALIFFAIGTSAWGMFASAAIAGLFTAFVLVITLPQRHAERSRAQGARSLLSQE